MISARLVGDDTVLAWLRAIPDGVSSGLARALTRLGIGLQRRTWEAQLTRQVHASPIPPLYPNVDLFRIEDGSDRIAARVVISSGTDAGAQIDVKGSLARIGSGFRPAVSKKPISRPSRRSGLAEQSFLRSALEEMDGAVRDEVEAALREALIPK